MYCQLCGREEAIGQVDEVQVCVACFDKFDKFVLCWCQPCHSWGWIEKTPESVQKIASRSNLTDDEVLFGKIRLLYAVCRNCASMCPLGCATRH